jgi:hypothetical protein
MRSWRKSGDINVAASETALNSSAGDDRPLCAVGRQLTNHRGDPGQQRQGAFVAAAATDVTSGLPGTAAVDVRAGRLTDDEGQRLPPLAI